MSVIVSIDHSTGDLTQYTSTVTDGGHLSVAAGAALAGTNYGLSCQVADTNDLYGLKTFTMPAATFRARFYIDPNTISMTTGNTHYVFRLTQSSGAVNCAIVHLAKSATSYQISVQAGYDDGVSFATRTTDISDAPHYVELQITRATSNSSSDGSLKAYVDGTQVGATNTSIDNYDSWVLQDRIRFGGGWIDAGTSGTYYLDELVANDDGAEIGPVVSSITGTGAITFAGMTASGAGRVDIAGALASTFSGMTLSGAGNTLIQGALASTFGGMTLAGVGNNIITGVLGSTLAGMTLTGAGTVASGVLPTIEGAAAITFAGMTLSGSGNNIIQGASAITFAGMTLAGAGRVDIAAALARTFVGMSLSGAGNVIVTGALTSTFTGMTASASGMVIVQGAASITFGGMTVSGTGTVMDMPPVLGVANITFAGMSLFGEARVTGVPTPTLSGNAFQCNAFQPGAFQLPCTVSAGGVHPDWIYQDFVRGALRKREEIEEEELLMMALFMR